MPSIETDICAICGKNKATTRDHVPPRGIFAKPLPSDLITVPACSSCNGGASKDDEAFRTYLSLHVGISNPSSASLWEKHASRTIQHNKKLRNRLLSSMKPVHLTTESGIIIGRAMAGLWDSKAHDNVIERMIRGLYFHHYGSALGDQAFIKVQWLKSIPQVLKNESITWSHNEIADGKFVYRFARAEDETVSSVWIFQFYNRHWASGYSMPITLLEPPR